MVKIFPFSFAILYSIERDLKKELFSDIFCLTWINIPLERSPMDRQKIHVLIFFTVGTVLKYYQNFKYLFLFSHELG